MAGDSQNEAGAEPAAQQRFGRFYLQELLNSGGMADIWLVTDGRGKPYALRKLKDQLRYNFLARRRFLRSCKVLSRLNDSEFIVDFVEHGRVNGTLYMLMDYVEAANLKELFARHDPVLVENVAQILIDMAIGLANVHESGFMHLDFKPENVLVTRNGNVRLIDFDLAQPIPGKKPKKMSRNPGTPSYMSPDSSSGCRLIARGHFCLRRFGLRTRHEPQAVSRRNAGGNPGRAAKRFRPRAAARTQR